MTIETSGSPRDSLAAILSIERASEGVYAATLEDFWGASQAGDVLARAALAAADACPGQALHSLHASFLEKAPPGIALALRAKRLGEQGPVTRCEIRVEHERLLCHAIASFTSPGEGIAHQDLAPGPGLPQPEDVATTLEQARAEGWTTYAQGPIEFRRVSPLRPAPERGESCAQIQWVRPRAPLPADPRIHAAALVFLSGFYSHWAFERRVGAKFAHDRFEPLDHAVWLHRAAPWDDFLLLRAITEIGHAGRALERREIYTRNGILLASAAHEARVARS